MAFSKNNEILVHESDPTKLVIVSGPTFGTIAGLLLLGAALGAAGVITLQRSSAQNSPAGDLPATDAGRDKAMLARANGLIQRMKVISIRARNTAKFAGEVLAPRVQSAVSEAKHAAAQTEQELHRELDVD